MGVYVCYCLLKSSSGSRRMARRLWELQEYYEKICAPDLPQQAFVYGDAEAACLPFKAWPKGWRTGLDGRMDRCRTQDMLALSWRLLDSVMRRQPEAVFKLVILSDGPAEANEESVNVVKDRLQELKGSGLEIIFAACTPEADSSSLRTLVSTEIGAGEDAGFILGGS